MKQTVEKVATSKKNESDSSKGSGSASRRSTVIILAAGKGTRMKTPLPKVLHPVAGRPMIVRIIEICKRAGFDEVRLVLGHGLALVQSVVEPFGVACFAQAQALGTGNAVAAAELDSLQGDVVILNGDHPLIESEDLRTFLKEFRESRWDFAVATAHLKDPRDFGRIVRQGSEIKAIVEAKDASADTLKIKEINTGIYVSRAETLQRLVPEITNENAKGEYYFTDMVSLCIEERQKIGTLQGHPRVSVGVNTQEDLARATRLAYASKAKQLMESGVLIFDPRTTYVEDSVEIQPGAVLHPQVHLKGQTRIGAFCAIEPNCIVVDSDLGEAVLLRANSYVEKTQIAARAQIGPFARLRPETEIGEEAQVGNFVEMKKVKFGRKSKAGHLTYLGDAEVGEDTNIGCGTITCNYAVDRKKYKTIIGSRVFVGSDTQFVAPVKIGDEAVIGSGSTITKDVPDRALAVARGKQIIKENYVSGLNAESLGLDRNEAQSTSGNASGRPTGQTGQ